MNKLIRINLFILLLTTACASKFKVQSNPDKTEVYVVAPNSEEKKYLGQAPINKPLKEVLDLLHIEPSGRQFVRLVVEAKNFETKELMVPVGVLSSEEILVQVKLKPFEIKPSNSRELVQYLLNAQELLNLGEFNRADLEIEKAIQLEKTNPWSYMMRGHIYFLKRDYKVSLLNYEKSLELDPTNKMVLKKIVDIRKYIKEKENEKR